VHDADVTQSLKVLAADLDQPCERDEPQTEHHDEDGAEEHAEVRLAAGEPGRD
jgi:hypothetical protein